MRKRSALFCDITHCLVVVMYRRFGRTYRSHCEGWRSPRRKFYSWISFAKHIDSPWKHCCATLSILLTMTRVSTTHTECIVVLPLQNGYANATEYFFTRTLPILLSLLPQYLAFHCFMHPVVYPYQSLQLVLHSSIFSTTTFSLSLVMSLPRQCEVHAYCLCTFYLHCLSQFIYLFNREY
jgi:hypothetical protein